LRADDGLNQKLRFGRLPTTFVSNALRTAAVPASAIAAPGPDAVAVVNPAPGGGASAALNFAVPCVIPAMAWAAATRRFG
jgi:hypothetical protein